MEDVVLALTDSVQPDGYIKEKICAVSIRSLPKGGGKLPPPLRYLQKADRKKGLKRENLRDCMDDFELIFNMLGERATTEIHRTENSKGLPKLKADAKAGGDIAGGARRKLEKRLNRSVVSKDNFLKKPENKKQINSSK